MFLKWDDVLKIDNAEIDEDHKNFLKMLDDVLMALDDDYEGINIDVAQTVTDCMEYVALHLATEEILMRKIGFPATEDHRDNHDKVLLRIGDIAAQLNRGDPDLRYKVFMWIVSYAHKHIGVFDRELGAFCQQAGIVSEIAAASAPEPPVV